MLNKPYQKEFSYYISATSPCGGCHKCETACFNTNYKRIQKINIHHTSAIGVLPGDCDDYWPMIINELCNNCGECARVCPDMCIEHVIWNRHSIQK